MEDKLWLKSKIENGGLSVKDFEDGDIVIEYCAYWPNWSEFWNTDRNNSDPERIVIIFTTLGSNGFSFTNKIGIREQLVQVDLVVCENTDKYDPYVVKGSLINQIDSIFENNLTPNDKKSLHYRRERDLDGLDEGVLRFVWSVTIKS